MYQLKEVCGVFKSPKSHALLKLTSASLTTVNRDDFYTTQCRHSDKNTRCNPDLNMCQCLPRYKHQRAAGQQGREGKWCMGELWYEAGQIHLKEVA